MTTVEKINFSDRIGFNSMIADCLGCKWTILLMEQIAQGINRPGQLVRKCDRLSTKVLNQCLRQMIKYGIIEKKCFAQIPPKVEYALTPFGLELFQLLKEIELLQAKYFQSDRLLSNKK